jgi:hypothetical protein
MNCNIHVARFGAWSLILFLAPGWLHAEELIQLREAFSPGYQYHVSTRVELSGSLSLPAAKGQAAAGTLPIKGESAIDYDERVLAVAADNQVQKTARIYRRIDLQRHVGAEVQRSTLRPEVRRLVVLRHQQAEVPFSPDGPLTWGEIDLVRTDVFTPALAGLLPADAVRPGDHWVAASGAIQELTDLERIEEGQVECRLEQLTLVEQRRHARVALSGTVRGVNEDGPNRQQLDGYFYFDLESRHVSYLYLKGIQALLDKEGHVVGRIEGRFVLTRQAHQHAADLAVEAWKHIGVEPTADNTLLLYDNPQLGVRLLYPRRWRVAGVRGRQLAVDEANGSGLLLTLEPAQPGPTGAQFATEVQEWIKQQKARVLRSEPIHRLAGSPADLDAFGFELELSGQRVVMNYFVTRQALGGATITARLLPRDLAAVQPEAERIARSVVITRRVSVDPGK